eukprot:jgi/Ulvmu1/897/UM101_0005.1
MKAVLLALLAILSSSAYGWSVDSLPDPQTNPKACGREVIGWVCSPDGVVDKDTLSIIQGNIVTIYAGKDPYSELYCPHTGENVPVELMAVIVSKVDGDGNPADKVAHFAAGLHDRFGVGSKACGSGAVIVISVKDRQVYISTGDLVGRQLKQPQIEGIISGIRPDLRDGKYGKAMEAAVIQVGLTLSGKVNPAAGGGDDSSFDWGLAFFGSIVAGFFGLSAWTGFRKKREQKDVRSKLQRMQRDLKASKEGRYVATSCPICLDDFTPATDTAAESEAAGDSESRPLLDGDPGNASASTLQPSAPPMPDWSGKPTGSSGAKGASRSLAAASSGAAGAGSSGGAPATLHAAAASFSAPASDTREPFMLPCGHTFCEACITEWLNRHQECPVCRRAVDSASVTRAPPQDPTRQAPADTEAASPRLRLRPPRRCRGYGGTSFYWHDSDFDLYGPELAFRLARLRRYHPDYITQGMVDDMMNEAHGGGGAAVPDWGRHPAFVQQISAQSRSEMHSAGSHSGGASFGGGASSGGGGGGW